MVYHLSLIFFGLLAFLNAIPHPFVHDDVLFILNNPHIADLGHWYQAFIPNTASGGLNTYYRPVLEIIYRLEYHVFGLNPAGFHLVNVLLHILNGLLLFGLLLKLGLSKEVSWAVSLLFLVHPVQTEAVACISGISNLWMALGVLSALHAYLNRWYGISLLCFILAFLGKEQAVLLVPLVIVIDCARFPKIGKIGDSALFWALASGILMALRHLITGASLWKDIMASPGELLLRLEAVPRDIEMYLRLIFYPYDLHYYRSTDILQPNLISWILGLGLLLGIIYTYKRWPQTRRTLVLGLGWFLAALLPVLNIIPLINEYSFILTPEHFLYLPIVGILLILVSAGEGLKKWGRLPIIFSLVLSACILMTWFQNNFWRSEIALFNRMLQFEPDFGRGHLLLAKAYYFNGEHKLADLHFARAYQIMTVYANKASNPTARNFYLQYLQEIRSQWAWNDRIR